MIAPDLVGIDVDLDHLLLGLEPRQRAARANGQDDVRLLEVFLEEALGIDGRAEREVVVIADGALAFGRLDDARLQILGDVGDRLMSAGAVDAPAGIDDGPARREQQRHRSLDVVSAGSRAHDE